MEYKLGYTPRIESSLKSLSPRSLCQTVLDWIDDNKVERPYGDSSSVRIKYSKLSTKPPTKPSLLREIYRDWVRIPFTDKHNVMTRFNSQLV